MHDEEQHDRSHAEKMHEPCGLEIVEQRRQLGELHRLPDRETGQNDDDADQNDADIEQLLDSVVAGEVIVLETQGHSIADRSQSARARRAGNSLRLNRPVTIP